MEYVSQCFLRMFAENIDQSLFDLFEIFARQCKCKFDSILLGDLSIGE